MTKLSVLGIGLALVLPALTLQAAAPQGGKPADFSGVWLLEGGGGDNGDSVGFKARPQSQWSNQNLPFTPEVRAACSKKLIAPVLFRNL